MFAIVPNLEPDVCGCCALAIDATLADVIAVTRTATTTMISGLAVNACYFFLTRYRKIQMLLLLGVFILVYTFFL